MSQESSSSYLYRRLDKLEEQVAVVMRKHSEYDRLEQNRRIDEEKDVERVKQWIHEKDRKEAKVRTTLDGLKKQLDADEQLKKRQQSDIDELSEEVHYIGEELRKSIGNQLENEVLEKLEKLTKSVDDLQNGRGTSTYVNKNESAFDRKMRSVTDMIVQNGEEEKETHENRCDDVRHALEKVNTELENQRKQIELHKVSQDCFAKLTDVRLQANRNKIDELKEFRNQTIHRVDYLGANIDEIDYYAREMYTEQGEHRALIEQLIEENINLRSEYSSLQDKMFNEIQALRDEMEEMRKKDDQSERVESPESVPKDNTDSMHSSFKTLHYVPIRDAIIGEWKLIACENMEKLCSENKSLNLVARTSERIRINISRSKLTTYYYDNGVFKREEKFKFGNAINCSNHCFVEKQSIKSKNYLIPSKVESLETCMRYIDEHQRLVIMNDINGCSATRVYEKCVE
ncbi:unnamed protein product [Caenorhabditis brenneri]